MWVSGGGGGFKRVLLESCEIGIGSVVESVALEVIVAKNLVMECDGGGRFRTESWSLGSCVRAI